MKSIPVVFLLVLFTLTACTTTSSQEDMSPSRIEILEKLEEVIPYEEYSLSFNTNKENSSLTLWLVDPDLDSHAEEGLRNAIAMALLKATTVIFQMDQTDELVGELFDFVNLIIVDPEYVGVFSGVLSLENIPDLDTLDEDELIILATSFEVDYRLRDPMAVFISPPDTACTWEETREKITRNFPVSNPNVDFFYVYDALGSTVWAQFLDIVEGGTEGYATLKVKQIIEELDCLYPPANKINTIVIDDEGEVRLVGSISAAEEATGNIINGFNLSDYTYSVMLEAEE